MLLTLLVAALALAQPPEIWAPQPADQALLAEGGVVARSVSEVDGFRSLGAIDIAAPPAAVIAAVVDLPARVGEVDHVAAISVYRQEPGLLGARWVTSALGFDAIFSVLYRYDLGEGWCTYQLDPSQDNDLARSTGTYRALQSGSGTRLLFENASRTPYPIPLWMQQRVQLASLAPQLRAIKARAEALVR